MLTRLISVFCLAWTFSADAKQTICLNMIVKDESACIREALDSVKSHIDYWVIVDTGSSDGTQEIIKDHMKGIPGELHERPWKDFAHNRNEALELAKNKADYLFWLDGDDWMETDADFQLQALDKDAYLVKVKGDGCSYYRYHLLKSSLPWRWEGVLHECIVCDKTFSSETLDGIIYRFSRDGIRAKPQDYSRKHIEILEEALKKEPNNSRYIFYLAQTYRDARNFRKSIELYQKRVDLGGWNEEVYFSLLQIAKLSKILNMDIDTIIDRFSKAHRCRPHRLEPIYYLAEIYNSNKQFALAYECLNGAKFLPKLSTPEVLIVETWIQDWGLLYQLSVCASKLNQFLECSRACDKLLEQTNLPKPILKEVELNKKLSQKKLEEKGGVITIHIDGNSEEDVSEQLATQIADIFKEKIRRSIQKETETSTK